VLWQFIHGSTLTTSNCFSNHLPAGVFGAYLLAVYDDEGETYQTISKLGTGFSEEQLTQLADSLRPAIIAKPRSYYKVRECGGAVGTLIVMSSSCSAVMHDHVVFSVLSVWAVGG
jgi:ATP-dependent DNA ligase